MDYSADHEPPAVDFLKMAKFRKTFLTSDEIIARARKALEKHPAVVFAYLFGSQVREKPTPMSDVDIAVFIEGENLQDSKLAILGDLLDGLETDDIDLVILNTAPLALKGRMIRNRKILIARKPFIRHSFESLTVREYFDFSIREAAIQKRSTRLVDKSLILRKLSDLP